MKTFSTKYLDDVDVHQRLTALEKKLDIFLLGKRDETIPWANSPWVKESESMTTITAETLVPFDLAEAQKDMTRVRHATGAVASDISYRGGGEIWVKWLGDLRVGVFFVEDYAMLRLVAKPKPTWKMRVRLYCGLLPPCKIYSFTESEWERAETWAKPVSDIVEIEVKE